MKTQHSKIPILHLFLLGLCLVLFTYFATTDLALPGPQDDESHHAVLAIDLLRPPFPYSPHYTLHFGRQPFPFGVCPHAGALKAYLLWPLFAFWGPSVELARSLNIFFGLLALAFCFSFVLGHFGHFAAFCATLLLALDSSFIFYSKIDESSVIEQIFWLFVLLWAFGRFYRNQRLRDLGIGLSAGILGTYNHITFIWFLVASLFVGVLFFPRELSKLFKKKAVYLVIPGALLILTIFFYWLIGGRKLLFTRPPGVLGAFVMFERLSTAGGVLPDVLSGRFTDILFIPGIRIRPLTDVLLIVCPLFLLYQGAFRSRVMRFLFLVAGVILLEISLTPRTFTLRIHRMFFVYIFLILLAGVAVAQSGKVLKNFKAHPTKFSLISLGVVLLTIASIIGQVSLKQEADRRIRQTGGKGFWSDGIYTVAEALEREKWENTVCLDWGYASLIFLTQGEMPLSPMPWSIYVDQKTKWAKLIQLVHETSPRTLFLLKPSRKPGSPAVTLQEFKEAVQESGKEARLEHLFCDREGDPLYMAYTIRMKQS